MKIQIELEVHAASLASDIHEAVQAMAERLNAKIGYSGPNFRLVVPEPARPKPVVRRGSVDGEPVK